jgi:hypothetical protein
MIEEPVLLSKKKENRRLRKLAPGSLAAAAATRCLGNKKLYTSCSVLGFKNCFD